MMRYTHTHKHTCIYVCADIYVYINIYVYICKYMNDALYALGAPPHDTNRYRWKGGGGALKEREGGGVVATVAGEGVV